jgi:hypothetical protein
VSHSSRRMREPASFRCLQPWCIGAACRREFGRSRRAPICWGETPSRSASDNPDSGRCALCRARPPPHS